jgi:hypothetical protein
VGTLLASEFYEPNLLSTLLACGTAADSGRLEVIGFADRLSMSLIKGLVAGLVLAGILALLPAAAFARGGGGGGHFGGGGYFGGGHFGGPAGHGFAFRHAGHFGQEGFFWDGAPYWDEDPFAYDYPPYGDPYEGDGGYPAGQVPAEPRFSSTPRTIFSVQRELTHLGYYHGQIDGLDGPQTKKAVRWFQSVDSLPVTGQIDRPTLKSLRVSWRTHERHISCLRRSAVTHPNERFPDDRWDAHRNALLGYGNATDPRGGCVT